jgi:predicted aspartyl protease
LFKKEVLAVALLSFANAAQAECAMHRVAVLPITLWQDKIYVPVTIDGAHTLMFVDTGASRTTVSENVAQSAGLLRDMDHSADTFGVGGVESHLTIVEAQRLEIGGILVAHQHYPMAAFGQRLADGSPAGGLIGADLLSHFDIDIDIQHRALAFWSVAGCSTVTPDWPGEAGSAEMTLEPSGHVSVPVRLNESNLDLLIDTGSPGLVLSTRAAARAGAPPEVLDEGPHLHGRGVNNGAFEAAFHIFRRLEVAGQVFGDIPAAVVSPGRVRFDGDGLLGIDFLKRGRVWLSYGTGKFFVGGG